MIGWTGVKRLALLLVLLLARPSQATKKQPQPMTIVYDSHSITIGKGAMRDIKLPSSVVRVRVKNPDIVDTRTDQNVVHLLGVAVGSTKLVVTREGGSRDVYVVTVILRDP